MKRKENPKTEQKQEKGEPKIINQSIKLNNSNKSKKVLKSQIANKG